LLADQNAVFVVTTYEVDAYDAKTGVIKWSSPLGQGHVSIMSQLDSNVLRVYYGDQIYELDSGTGKILSVMPKGATVWISGNTVLRGFGAFDRQTGKLLWSEGYPFYLNEGIEPEDLGTDFLLVAMEPGSTFIRGICALDLHTGLHNWCRPEEFNSLMGVDPQSQVGYAVRGDFVLLTIDLQTGKVLGETSFISSELTGKELGSVSPVMVSDGIVVISFGDSKQTFGLLMSQ
jgi:outer membrane protein assembly factor BamB